MKCFECGSADALILFSSVLCANYKCSLYDRKHAEEISPVGLPDGSYIPNGATHIGGCCGVKWAIQGSSGVHGIQGACGIVSD